MGAKIGRRVVTDGRLNRRSGTVMEVTVPLLVEGEGEGGERAVLFAAMRPRRRRGGWRVRARTRLAKWVTSTLFAWLTQVTSLPMY